MKFIHTLGLCYAFYSLSILLPVACSMKISILLVIISACLCQLQAKYIPPNHINKITPTYIENHECDVSIFAVPKFIYICYLAGPHLLLKEFIRKTLKRPAEPNRDTSADFLYWLAPFIAPFAAADGISRSFKC